MFEPKTLIEQLMFATIRINGTTVDGGCCAGTGFFYLARLSETTRCLLLLTNKHVLKDREGKDLREIVLKFHLSHSEESNPCDECFSLSIPLNAETNKLVVPHPNPNVDITAIMAQPMIEQITSILKDRELKPFYRTFDERLIWSDDQLLEKLDAAREVLMVGYPIGMSDEAHNLPIVRKGVIASVPHLDFNDKPEGVVDIACFPGSSGSPILLYEEGMYREKNGGTVVGSRCVFLGILWGGPRNEAGLDVRPTPIPTSIETENTGNHSGLAGVPCAFFFTRLMVHLGYYVKAKEVATIVEQIKQLHGIVSVSHPHVEDTPAAPAL